MGIFKVVKQYKRDVQLQQKRDGGEMKECEERKLYF